MQIQMQCSGNKIWRWLTQWWRFDSVPGNHLKHRKNGIGWFTTRQRCRQCSMYSLSVFFSAACWASCGTDAEGVVGRQFSIGGQQRLFASVDAAWRRSRTDARPRLQRVDGAAVRRSHQGKQFQEPGVGQSTRCGRRYCVCDRTHTRNVIAVFRCG